MSALFLRAIQDVNLFLNQSLYYSGSKSDQRSGNILRRQDVFILCIITFAISIFLVIRYRQKCNVKKKFNPNIGVGTVVGVYRQIIHKYGKGSLLDQNAIPQELHHDNWLSKFICPITQVPIRDPVLDPNKITVYERSAILRWLDTHNTSPITRKPLRAFQLVSDPIKKMIIESRLRFHDQRIKVLIEEHLSP